MKTIITILALIVSFAASVNAQQRPSQKIRFPTEEERKRTPPGYVRLENGEFVPKVRYDATVANIQRTVEIYSKDKSPYIKFDDGSVVYLGKLLCEDQYILPAPTNTLGRVKLFTNGYKVADALSEGCRVNLLDNAHGVIPDLDIFVNLLGGYSDRVYLDYLIVKHVGDYQYKTVNGASRRIPKYTLGKDATKQEYLEYIAKSQKKP